MPITNFPELGGLLLVLVIDELLDGVAGWDAWPAIKGIAMNQKYTGGAHAPKEVIRNKHAL